MKRLLIFLICSVLVFSSVSFAATAAETEITDTSADTELSDTAAESDLADTAADADLSDVAADTDELAPTGWSLLTETQFQTKLNAMRSKYPNGSIWGGYYYEDGSVKASTCWAYAAQMLYEIFGVKFYADGMLNYKYYDSSGITAGDWVRIDYDSHSIFITKVTSSGVYFTDGNGTGVYNQVRWDGFYSWSEISSRFSYRLHLPGNTLTGNGVVHTVAYNANGGSGSMSSQSVAANGSFQLQSNGFTRSGYSFDGYIVKRSYDNKWYTTDGGWQTQDSIDSNGYHYKVYPQGNSYTLGTPWIGGITSSTTFTFYATWQPNASTVAYDANGGSGSVESQTVYTDEAYTLKENGFTRSGYTFAGYIVKRSFDNKWFTSGGTGWQTQSDIYNNCYYYAFYHPGESYRMSKNWLEDSPSATLTFYAQWVPENATVEYFSNYSGYNYILGSDLGSNYSNYIYSRSSSAYTVSVDTVQQFNNANSLKIVGSKAGSSGTDLAILTSTNKGYGDGYSQAAPAGDDKTFTLHFYAKSTVDDAKMYFRWGYSNTLYSVTLTKGWRTYSLTLPKNRFCGSALHPYFDKAGTFYINSLALGDNTSTTNVKPETAAAASIQNVPLGGHPTNMPTPSRDGYIFLGWYTAAEGGDRITSDSIINESAIRLYAHWKKDTSYTPVKTAEYNGHLYELYDNIMGWEEASAFCRQQGGHLISIGSEAENYMAYNMISDRQGYCWIGLHYQSSIGKWEWVDSTSLAGYNKWYDASYGKNDSGEYYALLYPMNYGSNNYAGTWDKCKGSSYYSSFYGYYNSFFICEYDAPAHRGDVSGDKEVDIMDVSLIQRVESGLAANTTETAFLHGDVDGSGKTDILDATYIQRYLSNIDTPYKVNEYIRP